MKLKHFPQKKHNILLFSVCSNIKLSNECGFGIGLLARPLNTHTLLRLDFYTGFLFL